MAGISVDPPSSNRGMVEKLDLPFPLLSDPRGKLIKSLDLWNEKEGVSEPAILVLDGSGTIRYSYSGGQDFSDRPTNDALFSLLDGVSKDSADAELAGSDVKVSASEAEEETVRPDRAPMELDFLKPYYIGTYFATLAMQKRLEGDAKRTVDEYQKLVNEYSDAIRETASKG